MMEVWKEIPDWEGYYAASDQGRIMSLARTLVDVLGRTYTVRQKILRPRKSHNCFMVSFSKGKEHVFQYTIAECVLRTFKGMPGPGFVPRHVIVGNYDDSLSNVFWHKVVNNRKVLNHRNYVKNKEFILKRSKIWAKRNPEKLRASQKLYRENNREKRRISNRNSSLKQKLIIQE